MKSTEKSKVNIKALPDKQLSYDKRVWKSY